MCRRRDQAAALWQVFLRADFDQLADQLGGIKGKFLLSINATEGARATFASFHAAGVATTYSVGGQAKPVTELIVSNFDLPR